ncbi:MAG: dockerin type I repeat-containing protein, partial [Clostridia bacterium]|nr:dockerin type I repeat-containing protein [Clostridia bacterium]
TDMKAEYKDGCLVFTTEHFSIYVVAEPEKEATPDEPVVDKGILGDVNGDGKVNIKDATQIQKFAAKIVELTDAEFIRADVNADTKVNIKDATAIQKFVAKLETGLPIGEPAA